ncbi:MAG: DnaJ domain-containing protein [Pseudanabaenaceae cyanobacterium]
MHIYDCYRVLGLPRNASGEDIKVAYRRLARKYHPDMNQNDPQAADKFREVQEAYRILKTVGDNPRHKVQAPQVQVKVNVQPPRPPEPPPPKVKVTTPPVTPDQEKKLRQDMIKRVQELIRQKRIVATIPIVEGLRDRFPNAPEVIHWQAIAYYRWGSELLLQGKLREAEIYLKKVLETDPKNRELCFEAKRDLERIASIQAK